MSLPVHKTGEDYLLCSTSSLRFARKRAAAAAAVERQYAYFVPFPMGLILRTPAPAACCDALWRTFPSRTIRARWRSIIGADIWWVVCCPLPQKAKMRPAASGVARLSGRPPRSTFRFPGWVDLFGEDNSTLTGGYGPSQSFIGRAFRALVLGTVVVWDYYQFVLSGTGRSSRMIDDGAEKSVDESGEESSFLRIIIISIIEEDRHLWFFLLGEYSSLGTGWSVFVCLVPWAFGSFAPQTKPRWNKAVWKLFFYVWDLFPPFVFCCCCCLVFNEPGKPTFPTNRNEVYF